MRYLKPSIHSVSACEPRPSAASAAALYPRRAWSLDTRPLVRGFSSRSARKPATASENLPMSTQMSARCFAQASCSSRLFMRPSFSASPPGRESRAARPHRYHSLKVPGVLDRLSLPYTALHWS